MAASVSFELRVMRFLVARQWLIRAIDPFLGWYNPFLASRRADPHPYYHRMREQVPVYFSRSLRCWVLTRYADVLPVLRHPATSVQRLESDFFRRANPFGVLAPKVQEAIRRNLLMLDPPDHTRLRGLVNKAFTPRRVECLRPRIEAVCEELLDRMSRRSDVDLIADFAHPLPVIVIAELLGVPVADREKIRRWSNDISRIVDPSGVLGGLDAVDRSFLELFDYLGALIADRRRAPRDDLISALATAEDAGEVLSEAEMVSTIGLLLAAGHETTTSLIGNAVLTLLGHPGERKRLQDDPALITRAVEEFLRFESPVQGTDRMAVEPLEVAGQRIPAGHLVVLLLAAANRDPARFPDPDRLDLGREDNRHLAFGHGGHFCLGAQLARLEAQIAIPALLRRFPDLAGDPTAVRWRPSMTLRGPLTLPLALGGSFSGPAARG